MLATGAHDASNSQVVHVIVDTEGQQHLPLCLLGVSKLGGDAFPHPDKIKTLMKMKNAQQSDVFH